jgi:hypothetical protein
MSKDCGALCTKNVENLNREATELKGENVNSNAGGPRKKRR